MTPPSPPAYRHYLLLGCLLLASALADALPTRVQRSGLEYQVDRSPAWVQKIAEDESDDSDDGGGSMQILLSDIQINLLGNRPVSYVHMRGTARERAGLEPLSTIRLAFNPRFETLTLHEVSVIRDGQRIDRLKTARVDLAQRESRLDEGVYDEDVEAIIALSDVRVGDIVEYAYSVSGDNPVFGGRFSRLFALNREQPVARLAVRIQYPANRQLHYKLHRANLPVIETRNGNLRTLQLDAVRLAAIRAEDDTPPWFSMFPWLQVSEYASWGEVNGWARGLYALPTEAGPEVDAVVARLAAGGGTPAEIAARALAWVQNEIRYYSVAVGSSSHRPNPPAQTLRQRFGDCKDKSVLLATLLNRLGIAAEPMLVASTLRRGIADLLPTPQMFDHVIVRARLDDATYWLDATQTYQGSALATLGGVAYGKALPAASPAGALAEVADPAADSNGTRVRETFRVSSYGAPAELEVEEKYLGALAEQVRRRIASDGLKRVVEAQYADYGKDFPNLSRVGETRVVDDSAANVLTLTQRFSIPRLFAYDGGRARMTGLYARTIVPWFRFPGLPDRRFPLALYHPASFEHRIDVELPNPPKAGAPTPEYWQDRHIAFSNQVQIDERRVSFIYGARTLRDHIAAADYPAFAEKFRQNAWPLLFSSLQMPAFDPAVLRDRLSRDLEAAGIDQRNADQADQLRQKFIRDLAIADEGIRSGRLAGPLLARAHRDRALAVSLLGQPGAALADAVAALALVPDDATWLLKGELLLYAGHYQDALDAFRRARQDGEQANTQVDIGVAHFYLKDYASAERAFARAAEIAGDDELPYALYWLALSARLAGHPAAPALTAQRARLAGHWPSEAVAFALGEIDQDKLLAAARRDPADRRLRLCEAYFYLGQRALLDGQADDARQWFAKAVATRVTMYREYTFAQHELQRLTTR